jgi:hypothetical protein
MRRTPLRKRSKNRIPTLRRKAWKLFSEFIRERDKHTCFTCGAPATQAGHYIHRDIFDFDEMAVHAQCTRCNLYLSGNLDVYTLKMIDTYGRKVVDELIARKHETHHWTVGELEEIILRYSCQH